MSVRPHDLTLVGATGFTGGLTAEYLAPRVPAGTSWAIAGRDRGRLEAVAERLAAIEGATVPELIVVDVSEPTAVRDLAESSRVVATTVGPYALHGEPLVAACAAAGTDYADLTGEPEFVDLAYARHHETARGSGARLVHCCGFDSIPHDLGALFTVGQLPSDVPIRLEGFVRAGGTFSGGTLHSAVHAFSRAGATKRAAAARRQTEPALAAGRRVRGIKPRPRRDSDVGAWVLPLPTIDPQIVLRSARALPRYGPDFSYGHYASVRKLPLAIGAAAGTAAVIGLAQLPPARRRLLGIRGSGDGPSAAERERGWFKVRFIGEGGGERVTCEVRGGDPGYGETAKMLGESALCLALDELPETAGQVTTATAMGDALTARLRAAGIAFETL